MISALLLIFASYFIGCFNTGYYLVRFLQKDDIRRRGSGVAGATNVGRSMGAAGFLATFAGDFAKGWLVVAAAGWFGASEWTLAFMVAAVTAGHIWPLQLDFAGGRGVATCLGVTGALSPVLLLGVAGAFGVGFLFTRYYTLAGLLAIALIPVFAVLLDAKIATLCGLVLTVGQVLWSQRDSLSEIRQRTAS